MPRTVWYNQGLSNVYDAVRLGREGDEAGELRFIASHTRPTSGALAIADHALAEPEGLSADEYVAWCLDVCETHGVDLFIPARHRRALSRRPAEFAAIGTRLHTLAAPETLDLLNDKVHTSADLAGTGVPLPEYRHCTTAEEYDRAYEDLRARHAVLCVKPTRGVFGSGFNVLDEDVDPYSLLLLEPRNRMRAADFRRALDDAATFPDLMLMEYLPGEERSVDAFAYRGELVTAVSRVKEGPAQRIEVEGPSIELARFLAARYSFSGIFNLQTKARTDGTGCFLEVNTRMSGGAHYAAGAGLLLPYWAVAVELGLRSPTDIPAPRPCTVAPVNAFVLV